MRNPFLTLLIATALLPAGFDVGFAQEEQRSLEELLFDRIILSGDFRVRHESFEKNPGNDRLRQRFRLRLASDLKIGDFLVGVRLASSTGEQVSTNQSFDNLFSQKPIWIDRAYLQWKAAQGINLTTGRMPNPFFRLYSTDLVWDEDVNPEGFAQNVTVRPFEPLALFANLGQLVLDEDANDKHDQWLIAEQIGGQVAFTFDSRATLAAAFYNFRNATRGTFGQNTVQAGNTRVNPAANPPNNTLLNAFRVLDLTGEITTKVRGLPVSLEGDYVKNLADTTGKDSGFQAGVRVGKASEPRTWEVAYYYKLLQTDATVADLADSDFGDGGTNRKGHIVWAAYSVTKALQLKTKFFQTQVEDESLPPGRDDIDRLQVDLSIKF